MGVRVSALWLAVLCVVGVAASGRVVINEVGWAGTAASGYDEWIELYNDSDTPVDLAGWVLAIGEREIPLAGTIPAHGFFLLERTDDSTVPGIAADLIYKGAMANSGAVLRLVGPGGAVVDTANLGAPEGWWAGDAGLRASMERISPGIPDGPVAWRTAPEGEATDAAGNRIYGTPGAGNAAAAASLPVSLAVPPGPLTGTVTISWEVEGNVEGLDVKLFVLAADGAWTTVAEGLPPMGAYRLDTGAFPNGAVLIALGAFDAGGPRGGAAVAGEIAN